MILAERYQVNRPLAQGGFGKTFLACDRYLPGNPLCVIKQFSPQGFTPTALKTAQRLFELEAQTLYQLGTYPQIPALLAHFEQAGEFYLVQDYIPGDNLAVELAEAVSTDKGQADQYASSLLRDLLTTLAFVHQQGVIHRDIKPANIIRRSTDQKLVLIDFGAVKRLSAGTALSTISIGSPGYIAPEQQAGRPCLASDLYAVGMIALYALTGRSPEQQPIDPQTGNVRLPIDSEHTGNVLRDFITRLIATNPADRFTDAASALQSLPPVPQVIKSGSSTDKTTFPPISKPAIEQETLPPSAVVQDAFPVTKLPEEVTVQTVYSATAERNKQALLNKVNRFWIQGVLEQSLHGQVLLTLGLEERSEAIALPWNITWKTDQQAAQPLKASTRIYDLFQQMGEGRSLLILGEPGAGKTTTLLSLARDLLRQSASRSTSQSTSQSTESDRIPAIFNLSSWTGEPIDQWLVTELNSKYQIPKSIGQVWVAEQQLLLLLDGLDEVRADRQSSCAMAINRFHQDYGPELVVCCRIRDYEALEVQLGLQSAVYVRSLTNQQIWQYLNRADTGFSGLRSLLQSSQSLFELARSPLILNIMALTYQGVSASQIPALTSEITSGENYIDQLFSAYIDRMFQRRDSRQNSRSPYSKQQTLRWLHELALTLTQTSQTVFLIERMQINWLNARWQRGLYVVLIFSCFLLVATAIGWHVMNRRALPLALVVGCLMAARIFGVYRIVPAEKLQWSWKKARRSFLLGLTLGPLIGWALKVGFVAVFSPNYCLPIPGCFAYISTIGLSFGTVLGATYGVIRGLSGSRIAAVTKPNQGIRQSAKNAILIALVSTIAPVLTSLLFENSTSSLFWASAGLSFGLALGGGEACAKHGVLRLVLWLQGRIPWNYARFLDYAAERIFLQKVGGGYIFIHRLLLEHFARRS